MLGNVVSSTFRHGYFVSNACYLPPLVPVVYYLVTVVYYPASVAYHHVSIACPISSLPHVHIEALEPHRIDRVLILYCPVRHVERLVLRVSVGFTR